jgi:hypothetical protein
LPDYELIYSSAECRKIKEFHPGTPFAIFIFMKKCARNTIKPLPCARSLAEAIILQSVEDLWDEGQRKECLKFFWGNGFAICAEIAGLDASGMGRLLGLVSRLTDRKAGSCYQIKDCLKKKLKLAGAGQ